MYANIDLISFWNFTDFVNAFSYWNSTCIASIVVLIILDKWPVMWFTHLYSIKYSYLYGLNAMVGVYFDWLVIITLYFDFLLLHNSTLKYLGHYPNVINTKWIGLDIFDNMKKKLQNCLFCGLNARNNNVLSIHWFFFQVVPYFHFIV